MKTSIFLLIFLTGILAVAESSEVGQISPRKAREYLKTSDVTLVPELKDFSLEVTPDNLKMTLELGLRIQSHGNESMIYDLKALSFIVSGSQPSGTDLQKNLYSLTVDILNAAEDPTLASGSGGYSDLFQLQGSSRVAARLALSGHEVEAGELTSFMRKSLDAAKSSGVWGNFANSLLQIRQNYSNTGEIKSSFSQVQELISHLPSTL